jgi:hypothetical protein
LACTKLLDWFCIFHFLLPWTPHLL